MIKTYDITPVAAPRMTKADRWKQRPCVLRYYDFKDDCKDSGLFIPETGGMVKFILPMPKSWSIKKKTKMNGCPHKQTPDIDNMLKAVLDAIYGNDKGVSDIYCCKEWGYSGKIVVKVGKMADF